MEFKNPGVTASLIVEKQGKICYIKRKKFPHKGMLALPGGFLNYMKESLEETAVRELKEETNLQANSIDIELLMVNSSPERDPRGHVIDHVYIVKKYDGISKAGDDASKIYWISLEKTPNLAFDHNLVIEKYKIWRKKMKESKFKKPSVTADLVIEDNGEIFLVQRRFNPYKECWAFPGGFLDADKETAKQTAKRETKEETGLDIEVNDLILFHESSDPTKNERGHIVSLFYATTKYKGTPRPSYESLDIKKFPLDNLPKMAFDHEEILEIYKIWKKKNER